MAAFIGVGMASPNVLTGAAMLDLATVVNAGPAGGAGPVARV